MKTVALLSFAIGCAKPADDSGVSSATDDGAADTETIEDASVDEVEDDTDPDGNDAEICSEDYSLCGNITIPAGFSGSTRSMAIVLYGTIPPAGPPDGIIAEIDTPVLTAGDSYPVRVLPALFNGDYYVWVNLYMEGGGEWLPLNGIDYTGSTSDPISFDGSAVSFEDIPLNLATNW